MKNEEGSMKNFLVDVYRLFAMLRVTQYKY